MKKLLLLLFILFLSFCSPSQIPNEYLPTLTPSDYTNYCQNPSEGYYVRNWKGWVTKIEKRTTDNFSYTVFISTDKNLDTNEVVIYNVHEDVIEIYSHTDTLVTFYGYTMNKNCDPIKLEFQGIGW